MPRDGVATHERRWRARLSAAGVTDAGDVEDFLLWCAARSAPAAAGGTGDAAGLAKMALLALEAAGDRPSVAGITNLEKVLREGEAGEEDEQCVNATVAYILIWGRDPTATEKSSWEASKASVGNRPGAKIDITSDEKYGKMQKASEATGRSTLRRALKSSTAAIALRGRGALRTLAYLIVAACT